MNNNQNAIVQAIITRRQAVTLSYLRREMVREDIWQTLQNS